MSRHRTFRPVRRAGRAFAAARRLLRPARPGPPGLGRRDGGRRQARRARQGLHRPQRQCALRRQRARGVLGAGRQVQAARQRRGRRRGRQGRLAGRPGHARQGAASCARSCCARPRPSRPAARGRAAVDRIAGHRRCDGQRAARCPIARRSTCASAWAWATPMPTVTGAGTIDLLAGGDPARRALLVAEQACLLERIADAVADAGARRPRRGAGQPPRPRPHRRPSSSSTPRTAASTTCSANFPGANGVPERQARRQRRGYVPQKDRDGSVLAELPPAWGGLRRAGQP